MSTVGKNTSRRGYADSPINLCSYVGTLLQQWRRRPGGGGGSRLLGPRRLHRRPGREDNLRAGGPGVSISEARATEGRCGRCGAGGPSSPSCSAALFGASKDTTGDGKGVAPGLSRQGQRSSANGSTESDVRINGAASRFSTISSRPRTNGSTRCCSVAPVLRHSCSVLRKDGAVEWVRE